MQWVSFMDKKNQNNTAAAQKFWDAFKACVEENRVRPDVSTFYVKWAQSFVNIQTGKRLRERSRQDIEGFLAELGERPGIKDWQVRQAEHAVKKYLEYLATAREVAASTQNQALNALWRHGWVCEGQTSSAAS